MLNTHLLFDAALAVEKHEDELAELITLENGKPLYEALKEVATAVAFIEYYAGWAGKLHGDTIPVSIPGSYLNYTVREPLGVVVGITPPNYPLTMPLYKAAPALATGNTIIIKPSEDTSLVPIRLAEIVIGYATNATHDACVHCPGGHRPTMPEQSGG